MKTKPPALLLALLFGLSCMAFNSAFAGDSKDSKDSKDSSVGSSTTSCIGKVDKSCGVSVILTSCTNVTVSGTSKDKDGKDEADTSKDKDSKSDKTKNDKDRSDNEDSHRDHADRSSGGNKVSICHRVGNSRQTLLVANDGWLSGHSKHDLDTIGRCADFDDAKNDDSKKDSDKKISASDAGYRQGLTPKQVDCLSNLPGTFSLQAPNRGGARTLR